MSAAGRRPAFASPSPGDNVVGLTSPLLQAFFTPSDVFDLTNWKITLPTGPAKDATEQYPLAGFEAAPWFIHRAGCVQFRAHCGGSTTAHSSYPRSELREMSGGAEASWALSGYRRLHLDAAFTAAPPVKPQVVCAQIHGESDDLLEVLYDGLKNPPAITWRLNGHGQATPLIPGYQLGASHRFILDIVACANRVRILVDDQEKASFEACGTGNYFKAGCYVQSNPSKGDSPNAYGEVLLYDLKLKADDAVDAC